MKKYTFSIPQARRFVLRHHGLLGPHRFVGKAGVLQYVRQSGCVQFDPVDVCGRNADLVFQSRVKGYTKALLAELLYTDRALVDYFDKNLAIIPVEDWPCFARTRADYHMRGRSVAEVEEAAKALWPLFETRESLSARELDMGGKVNWYWSDTSLARATLETFYFRGKLCVHHKEGTIKSYAPASRLIPPEILTAPDPNPTGDQYARWIVYRRVGALGLMWNRGSDVWLYGDGRRLTGERPAAFAALLADGKLIEVQVDRIKEPLYARDLEEPLLDEVAAGAAYAPRTELIAPLDSMIWDRKLLGALFDFDYTWEIYTPAEKRRYGHYTLPLISGEGFAGRVEAVCDRSARSLALKNVWWEGKPKTGELTRCLKRFARFNGCALAE